jgi:hypothetical protein
MVPTVERNEQNLYNFSLHDIILYLFFLNFSHHPNSDEKKSSIIEEGETSGGSCLISEGGRG